MEGHSRGGASTARALVLMEIGLGMSAGRGSSRPYRDIQLSLGTVRDGAFNAALTFGNGTPDIAHAVRSQRRRTTATIETCRLRRLSVFRRDESADFQGRNKILGDVPFLSATGAAR